MTCGSAEEAITGSHAIVILTEWDEFKKYDYETFYEKMQQPAFIFDGRNILDHEALRRIGYEVHGIGKTTVDGKKSWISGVSSIPSSPKGA